MVGLGARVAAARSPRAPLYISFHASTAPHGIPQPSYENHKLAKALVAAALNNHLDIVNRLLEIPHVCATGKNTIMHNGNPALADALVYAAIGGHSAITQRLFEITAVCTTDDDAMMYEGNPVLAEALWKAARSGHTAIVEQLLAIPGIHRMKHNGVPILYKALTAAACSWQYALCSRIQAAIDAFGIGTSI